MAPSRYGRTRTALNADRRSLSVGCLINRPIRADRCLSSEEPDVRVCANPAGPSSAPSTPTHTFNISAQHVSSIGKATIGVYIYMHYTPPSAQHFAWWVSRQRLMAEKMTFSTYLPSTMSKRGREGRKDEGRRKDQGGNHCQAFHFEYFHSRCALEKKKSLGKWVFLQLWVSFRNKQREERQL